MKPRTCRSERLFSQDSWFISNNTPLVKIWQLVAYYRKSFRCYMSLFHTAPDFRPAHQILSYIWDTEWSSQSNPQQSPALSITNLWEIPGAARNHPTCFYWINAHADILIFWYSNRKEKSPVTNWLCKIPVSSTNLSWTNSWELFISSGRMWIDNEAMPT